MARVNIVKKIKIDGAWKLIAIPRTSKGTYDWNSLPEGLYLIEWRAGGKRRREVAGVTASQALAAQRQKKHAIDGRTTAQPGYEISQRKRKRVEEVFGWLKTVAGMRKTKFRGKERIGWMFTFATAAFNLIRMRNLLAATA